MKEKLTLNQEIILSCAFRYALGRMTYVVGTVAEELINQYYYLSDNFKARIAKEIQEHQDDHGLAGMKIDNYEWNKVKWLFNENNRVQIKAFYNGTEKFETVTAIKENGVYYSIPGMVEYAQAEEIQH